MASRRQYTLELLLGAKTEPGYNSSIKNAEKALSGISSTAKKVAGTVTAAFAAVNVSSAIESAVEEYAGFEQELTNTAAIAGASKTEYGQLEAAAREAGMATTKTAGESAAALGYMALAGWDVEESTSALMPVLKLSESSNLDLARTSDLVTDSMGALKLEVSELPEYLDLVTKAQNSSNQTSEQLMEAYIRAGGAARSLGIDAKDTATALGILANNGTKAGEGGRTLNAMLTRIAANKEAVKQMKALGISIFDAKGNFVGFEEALKRMNKGLGGLTMEKQAKALKNIAGTQYYTKMKYLLDGVKEGANGSESAWDELERKLSHAEGTLDEMDAKITGTMSGQMQIMDSALSDAKISFGDAFKTEIVEVIQDFTGMFNGISEGMTEFADENEIKIHQTFEGIKENITDAGELAGQFAGGIIENFDKIEAAAAGLASMTLVSKTTKGFKAAADVLGNIALSSVGKGNLIAGGMALVAGAVTAIGVHAYNTHKKLIQADLEGHFGDISLSLEDIDEISQQIVGKKKLVKISEMLEAVGKTDEAVGKMADSMKEINKTSWKIRAGFKIDADDRESYKAEIQNYVKSAQDVIDNKGYSVSVATNILFSGDSKISKKNNAFYAGLDTELESLENKLNKKIGKAVENGVDIPTDKAIQKLLGKINTITSVITDSENEAAWQELEFKYSGKDLTPETFKEVSSDIQKYTEEADEGLYNAHKETVVQANAEKKMKLLKLEEKLDNKEISKKKYKKKAANIEAGYKEDVKEADQAYYDAKAKNILKSSKYLMKSITDAYPEVAEKMKNIDSIMDKNLDKQLGMGYTPQTAWIAYNDAASDTKSETSLDANTAEAVRSLSGSGLDKIFSEAQELLSQIKGLEGVSVPEALSDVVAGGEKFKAVSGEAEDSVDALYDIMAKHINNNEEYAAITGGYLELGADIGGKLESGITGNTPKVKAAIQQMLNSLGSEKYTANITVDMAVAALSPSGGSIPGIPLQWQGAAAGGKNAATKGGTKKSGAKPRVGAKKSKLAKNARGGIYSSPIATILAEDGDSEAVIPLNSSGRAKALWRNAGKMLGMEPVEDKTSYNSLPARRNRQTYEEIKAFTAVRSPSTGNTEAEGNVYITYSPQITIKGNADKNVINKALSGSYAEVKRMLDTYFAGKKRTSFSGGAAF